MTAKPQPICTFQNVSGDKHVCIHAGCGRVMYSPYPPAQLNAPCRRSQIHVGKVAPTPQERARLNELARLQAIAKANMPSLARRIYNRIGAEFVHQAKGKPLRTVEQATAILELHCGNKQHPCEYFTGRACGHHKCGCTLAESLLYADKGCPKKPPAFTPDA